MMHSERNPWNSIATPVAGFNVLRIDPDHPHDFFWGRDNLGNYLLLLRVDKSDSARLREKTVELRGVRTDIREDASTGYCYFILCLLGIENRDIFYHLCQDLVEATKETREKATALEILHQRMKRWRAFLSRKKAQLLSAQEVQGLFAELCFLERIFEIKGRNSAVISGWQGPLDGPHDFVYGNTAVEIKSVAGSRKHSVRISSENQLLTHLENLFLHVLFLAEYGDCSNGISLNSIVSRIRSSLTDAELIDLFDGRLVEAGYVELAHYDLPCFSITEEITYAVEKDFPRITPETLVEGLVNVSYDLLLSSIEDFKCEFPFC